MTAIPKPQSERRTRKPLRRSAPQRKSRPRKRSHKRATVEAKDAAWATAVKNPCGFILQCARCFFTIATDAHHVRSKKAHPDLRWDVRNGIGLCRQCHQWVHENPKLFKAWLLRNYPNYAVLWATPEHE